MADSAVAFLLDNLSRLLAHEAKLICGLEDRIRSLHNQLKIIDAFLKNSEGKKKKNNNQIEQEVASQIRDVAHEAEDVIDTFTANVAMHGRRSMLGRMLHGVDHAKLIHDVAEKVDKIKTTINEILDNRVKFDFENGESSTREEDERVQSLHKRRRNVEEEDVVGFVHDSKVMIKRLVEGSSRRNVVSIIGMGGLGKTTLARKIYNSNEVKEYFNCRALVYVSNDCRAREILLTLVKCLMPNHANELRSKKGKKQKGQGIDEPRDVSSLSEDELKQMVREYLKRKRYLLVLDDIWKTQDWDELQDAFPDDNRGSRILITSRLKEMASYTSRDLPYCLSFLNNEDSWELFSRRVFGGEECPPHLEPLGKQMVESCRGLPLSIIVLAGLLANKEKSHREWCRITGHVNWYLTRDETQVKDIVLKLSYDNLPRRLKPCFLYFGIFPEDFEIPVRELMERWVAEGFIQETGTRYQEDVAEDYLYELIDRSLIQVARVKTGGGVKTCRIHDLLRDLCISESKDDKVFEVCTENNILIQRKPRRLSVHCSLPHYVSSSNNDHSCVHSLFCFDSWYSFTPKVWKWLFKGLKLVRVLDLGQNFIIKIPSNLEVLIHLRYLRINSEYIGIIPASICTLRNLQTLDFGPSRFIILISFPNGLWKLKQLRHLYTPGPITLRGHRLESDCEVMWSLRTLSSIALNRRVASLIEKGRFPKLRKLSLQINFDRRCKLHQLLKSLQHLSHLNKLELVIAGKSLPSGPIPSSYFNIESHIGCKPQELVQSLQHSSHLNELKIYNAWALPTCGDAFPPYITKLTLAGISYMNDDGMNALGNLTNLRILRLVGLGWRSDPFDLNCVAGKFPQLQVFKMATLGVKNWKLANGAMPCLQYLVIDNCGELTSIPNELWSLTTLRKVEVLRPSEGMALILRNLEMKNGCELIIM